MKVFSSWLNTIKRILIRVGHVQTVVVMGVAYYFIIGPMAVLFQLFHRQKPSAKSYWIKKEPITDMDFYLKKQF